MSTNGMTKPAYLNRVKDKDVIEYLQTINFSEWVKAHARSEIKEGKIPFNEESVRKIVEALLSEKIGNNLSLLNEHTNCDFSKPMIFTHRPENEPISFEEEEESLDDLKSCLL